MVCMGRCEIVGRGFTKNGGECFEGVGGECFEV